MSLNLPKYPEHPVMHAFLAPLGRLWDEGTRPTGWLALLVGFVQAVWADVFTFLAVLVFLSGLADTLYGRRLHKILGTYDPQKAEIGLHGKIMGLTLALFIRGLEYWMRVYAVPDEPLLHTRGFIAVAILLTLFAQDLRSIQEKRERFGMGPIPVFTPILRWLEALADRFAGVPTRERGEEMLDGRRRHDDPERTHPLRREEDHEDEGE